MEVVFDIEADGLLDTVSKIHCLSYRCANGDKGTLTRYGAMNTWFTEAEQLGWTLIGHNIICYDLVVVERILGVHYKGLRIDTLPLSWYLHHDRLTHGLEDYGKDFGIKKPEVHDWENLTLEGYCHRCEQDVEINWALWLKLKSKLQELYNA